MLCGVLRTQLMHAAKILMQLSPHHVGPRTQVGQHPQAVPPAHELCGLSDGHGPCGPHNNTGGAARAVG